MLPKYNPNNPVLLESIVCFTDILGFSNSIINTPNRQSGNHLLKQLHEILKSQYSIMRVMNPHGHFKTFTDNVILAYPKFDDGESQSGSVFMSFIDYQLEMTLNGYFLRGGIALGDYYGDEEFAYGPALIEAHDLESNSSKAIYPRIILSDKMIKTVSQHLDYYGTASFAPQFSHLLIDQDDKVFINYLYGLHEIYETTSDYMEYIQKVQSHRDIIVKQLNNFQNQIKIYSKYEWVAQYHNFYCDEHFEKVAIQQFNLKVSGVPKRNFSRIAQNDTVLI